VSSARCHSAFAEATADRSGAEGPRLLRRSLAREARRRRLPALLLALLLVPSNALAQRDAFFSTLLDFYKTLGGVYGDEGPQLVAQVGAIATALERWDDDIRTAEQQLRSQLKEADAQTQLQVHTTLASLYMERGRFKEALREFDEDLRIDSRRAVFHRYKGLIHQFEGRAAEAADAFRAAWLLDPDDPQNSYRLLAFKSTETRPQENERALETLATVERDLIEGRRARAVRPDSQRPAPFTNLSGVIDDAGGAMAFVPAAYARGFSLVLNGQLDSGLDALRTAVAADPLVIDAARNLETMTRGSTALREGLLARAIEQFEATTAAVGGSAEAHRMLGTAYAVNGDITRSLQHLREAVRLNARDERSWLALVRTVDESNAPGEAEDVVHAAIAALPDAGAFRWQLATIAAKRQRTNPVDLALMTAIDRYVVLVGRGELHMLLAKLVQTHLDYQTAIGLLERAASLIPNNVAAHKSLARAYTDEGRDSDAYAELVVALMLDPDDAETLTGIGRVHMSADRVAQAIGTLRRAVAIDPANQQAVHALAEAFVRAGQADEGHKWLEESDRLRARSIEEERLVRTIAILTLQAEVREREREYATATDLWDQIVRLRPRSASNHLRLADAQVSAQRLDEAAKTYQTAISLGAGAEAHRRLAAVQVALGREAESVRERATYVQQRLEELRQRAAEGPAR
jgi:tetratricopeptide (TPR) repeat protein